MDRLLRALSLPGHGMRIPRRLGLSWPPFCKPTSMTASARLVLKPGREKSLRHRHPWVFSGAVERVEGIPAPATRSPVVAHDGALLAWAACSPASQIRARVWSFDPGGAIDEAFLRARLEAAVARRAGCWTNATTPAASCTRSPTAFRGSSSIATATWRSCSCFRRARSAGAISGPRPSRVLRACAWSTSAPTPRSATLEGLAPRSGPLLGDCPARAHRRGGPRLRGGRRPRPEDRLLPRPARQPRARAPARGGRRSAERLLLHGGLHAGGAGRAAHAASCPWIRSEEALALARRNAAINGLDAARAMAGGRRLRVPAAACATRDGASPHRPRPAEVRADRKARGEGGARLQGHQPVGDEAARAGRDLLTFSCSGAVGAELFQKIVAGAAADARVDLEIARAPGRLAGPPRLDPLSRRRVPQGTLAAGCLRPYNAGFLRLRSRLRSLAPGLPSPVQPDERSGYQQHRGHPRESCHPRVQVQDAPAAEDLGPVVVAASHQRQRLDARVGHVARDVQQVLAEPDAARRGAGCLPATVEMNRYGHGKCELKERAAIDARAATELSAGARPRGERGSRCRESAPSPARRRRGKPGRPRQTKRRRRAKTVRPERRRSRLLAAHMGVSSSINK